MNQRKVVHGENLRRYTGFCVPISSQSSITLPNGILNLAIYSNVSKGSMKADLEKIALDIIFVIPSKFDTTIGRMDSEIVEK